MKIRIARRQFISLVDQGLQAGCNMVATVLLARCLPIDGFAVIATSLAIWFFFEALQRTGILMPYISSVTNPKIARQGNSIWGIVNMILMVGGGVLLFLLSLVLPGVVGESMFFAAGLVPCAGLFTYGKRLLYHIDAYGQAMIVSAFNILVLFVFLFAIQINILPPAVWVGATSYIASFLAGGLLSFFYLRGSFERPRALLSNMRAEITAIRNMSVGAVAAYFYNNGVQFVIASFSVAGEAAAFAATRVLVRPINVISVAISDVERSTAARIYQQNGDAALVRFLRRLLVTLAIPLLPIGIVLFIYSPDIIGFIFKGKYDEFSLAGRVWIVAFIPQIIALPLDIRQSVQSRSSALLVARTAGAFGCLAVLLAFWWVNGILTAVDGIVSVGVGRSIAFLAMLTENWFWDFEKDKR